MSGITYDYMEQYIRSLIREHKDEKLAALEKSAKENAVPIIHQEVGKFIEAMINIKRPKKILELGTAVGYSAILMCKASGDDCRVTTIERDSNMIAQAKSNIASFGYEDKITLLEGDALEILGNLQEEFDMIFMDAGKGHYNHFWPHCERLLKNDGMVIADNVLFRGMVASKELIVRRKITIVKRMKKFLDMVSGDERYVTSIIPMGDGIALITRRNGHEQTGNSCTCGKY